MTYTLAVLVSSPSVIVYWGVVYVFMVAVFGIIIIIGLLSCVRYMHHLSRHNRKMEMSLYLESTSSALGELFIRFQETLSARRVDLDVRPVPVAWAHNDRGARTDIEGCGDEVEERERERDVNGVSE